MTYVLLVLGAVEPQQYSPLVAMLRANGIEPTVATISTDHRIEGVASHKAMLALFGLDDQDDDDARDTMNDAMHEHQLNVIGAALDQVHQAQIGCVLYDMDIERRDDWQWIDPLIPPETQAYFLIEDGGKEHLVSVSFGRIIEVPPF